ncbi:hypothetical protein PR202_gb02587 [Eleusine coracana subsp. coracana]|uniref:WHEP-TRS domain-containing protein n=1 Tax=Eleusine coracana subsp. coracana TaxID=191504 RepID=A0AAV5DZG5_ELECO|nr:hypothetical protein PR202_gb02587 [Eleusine coracana subsp. coracana]
MRFRPQLIFSSLCRSLKPRTSSPPATLAAATAAARRQHTTAVATSMAAPSEDALRRALAERQAAVDAQAEAVRALKAGGGASKAEVDAAVEALKALKVEAGTAARRLQQSVGAGPGGAAREEMRQAVVNTLERKLFYIPSFKIYRGVAGLYDYGPPGCRVKANVLSFWRQGHVEKFTDLMVKDEKTGTCYRADHLLKDFCMEKLEKDLTLPQEKADEFKCILAILDDLSAEELGAKIKEHGIVAPDTKNPLSDPYPFNLMFQTSIGPTGLSVGYMRLETAQGIFVNFKDLYYYNGQKLPLYFVVVEGIVNNETLGYFIGRVYLFLTRLGIDKGQLRFRQHLPNEMAHYAADCWDAEIECSYGWIECVGIADRSAYDLKAHSEKVSHLLPTKNSPSLKSTAPGCSPGLCFYLVFRVAMESTQTLIMQLSGIHQAEEQ